MSRINVIEKTSANAEQLELLTTIENQLGMIPNFLKVLANSPVALRAFLGLYGVANAGEIDALTRERIALALAQQNNCEYCVSAHTAIGQKTGLSRQEIQNARAGTSEDIKAAAIVKFANALMEKRGEVSSAEITTVRNSGVTDAELIEIITHVGMNFLTNILGKASLVEIDFPKVNLKLAA